MRLFLILVLIFNFQTLTKANDITDFEIEGITVGYSLLDFFSKNQIENEKSSEFVYVYPDKKFMKIGIGSGKEFYLQKNIDNYDDLGVIIKPDDMNYIVYGIQGRIFCDDGIDICFSTKEEILSELKKMFSNIAKLENYENSHSVDKSGKSMVYISDFVFKNTDDTIGVSVYDWSDDMTTQKKWFDNVKLDIFSAEYVNYLRQNPF